MASSSYKQEFSLFSLLRFTCKNNTFLALCWFRSNRVYFWQEWWWFCCNLLQGLYSVHILTSRTPLQDKVMGQGQIRQPTSQRCDCGPVSSILPPECERTKPVWFSSGGNLSHPDYQGYMYPAWMQLNYSKKILKASFQNRFGICHPVLLKHPASHEWLRNDILATLLSIMWKSNGKDLRMLTEL